MYVLRARACLYMCDKARQRVCVRLSVCMSVWGPSLLAWFIVEPRSSTFIKRMNLKQKLCYDNLRVHHTLSWQLTWFYSSKHVSLLTRLQMACCNVQGLSFVPFMTLLFDFRWQFECMKSQLMTVRSPCHPLTTESECSSCLLSNKMMSGRFHRNPTPTHKLNVDDVISRNAFKG